MGVYAARGDGDVNWFRPITAEGRISERAWKLIREDRMTEQIERQKREQRIREQRERERGKLGAHYEECWREHHDCAVHEVERLQTQRANLLEFLECMAAELDEARVILARTAASQALTRDLARAVAQLREHHNGD